MSIKEGFRLPVFSHIARTHKYQLAEKLAMAQRFRGPWPSWLRLEVDELIGLGKPTGEVILTVLDRHNVAVRSQHLRRS
jgi:hypothetical protein